jgi:SAM-dependent methyltransferase
MSNLWRRELGQYDGLLMRCAPGTHEAAMALLLKHASARRPAVLDVASGSGAFLARLRDQGFGALDAIEIDRKGFTFPGIEPRALDLNGPFAARIERRYGLITALEILEHLDCPRHFLRELHALLDPGGWLLLSTPNTANWTGRLRFFLSGEHRQFREHDYHYQRHISPTTDVQLRLMLQEIGFEVVERVIAGSFFGSLKKALLSPIIALGRLLWGPIAGDDVRIYLVRRSEPDRSSPGATSFYFEKTQASGGGGSKVTSP